MRVACRTYVQQQKRRSNRARHASNAKRAAMPACSRRVSCANVQGPPRATLSCRHATAQQMRVATFMRNANGNACATKTRYYAPGAFYACVQQCTRPNVHVARLQRERRVMYAYRAQLRCAAKCAAFAACRCTPRNVHARSSFVVPRNAAPGRETVRAQREVRVT